LVFVEVRHLKRELPEIVRNKLKYKFKPYDDFHTICSENIFSLGWISRVYLQKLWCNKAIDFVGSLNGVSIGDEESIFIIVSINLETRKINIFE
jgi:hypothetical protein